MEMKSIGIVRRIDDLGRIAIPKELRRTLNIQAGDPLEIFVDNSEGVIMLQKYTTAIEEFNASLDGIFRVAHDLKIALALSQNKGVVKCNDCFKRLSADDMVNVKSIQIGEYENALWEINYAPLLLDGYQSAQVNFIVLTIRDKAIDILGDY